MGGSSSKQTTDFIVKEFPGLFGTPEGARVGGKLENILGRPAFDSPFSQPLEQALLQPTFGPETASEQALLGSIMDVTAGRGAVRGLGAPTQASLAQSVAPQLIGMRQQGIENLLGAQGQDITAGLGERGQTIGGLTELAGLVMPQLIGGGTGTGKSKGLNLI